MQIRIATIAPVHNQIEATKTFLKSYYASLKGSSLEDRCSLIIVDDGSTDGTSRWLSEHHPEIEVLKGDGWLWWSGSMNLALKHVLDATFTHALLFNNDNTLHPDFFRSLERVLETTGGNEIISSKVINIHPAERVIYGGVTFDRRKAKYVVNSDPDKPVVVNTAGGMGVLIPVAVVRKVGFYDAVRLPQKSGDTDFCLRAERAGFKVHYQPSLTVYNDNSTTGDCDNTSIRAIIAAYSFPKGYMNLGVDLRLFLSHGNRFWAIYRIAKNNFVFLAVGAVRILKASARRIRNRIKI